MVNILANGAISDFVKIGFTVDLAERMWKLDKSGGAPFKWDCVYSAEVENPGAWVWMVRDLFAGSRVSRCLFHTEVTEQALGVLRLERGEEVKLTSGGKSRCGKKSTKGKKGKRGRNFDFEILAIETRAELEFPCEVESVCRVTQVKPPRVEYVGEDMTLTEAAERVLGRESTKGVQGPLYWRYEGETLVAPRLRLEQ